MPARAEEVAEIRARTRARGAMVRAHYSCRFALSLPVARAALLALGDRTAHDEQRARAAAGCCLGRIALAVLSTSAGHSRSLHDITLNDLASGVAASCVL